jgi:hypothetical protein
MIQVKEVPVDHSVPTRAAVLCMMRIYPHCEEFPYVFTCITHIHICTPRTKCTCINTLHDIWRFLVDVRYYAPWFVSGWSPLAYHTILHTLSVNWEMCPWSRSRKCQWIALSKRSVLLSLPTGTLTRHQHQHTTNVLKGHTALHPTLPSQSSPLCSFRVSKLPCSLALWMHYTCSNFTASSLMQYTLQCILVLSLLNRNSHASILIIDRLVSTKLFMFAPLGLGCPPLATYPSLPGCIERLLRERWPWSRSRKYLWNALLKRSVLLPALPALRQPHTLAMHLHLHYPIT